MPWCDDCSRWFSPNALSDLGECPRCDVVIDDPPEPGSGPASLGGQGGQGGAAVPKIPWHFWMLVGALALYMGWRLIQGVAWVAG